MLVVLLVLQAGAQNWSSFLDSSRAVDWSSAGFTIPNYTTNCATQPTLLAGSANDAANATAITNALNSCDATHNVVNLPAGTYYVTGWTYPSHGYQVVRGAGPNSTYIYTTGTSGGCNGWLFSICIGANTGYYFGNSAVLAGGSHQCAWSAGYAQGSTTITLSSCGGVPPANSMLMLDQANDSADTNGVYICDSQTTGCVYKTPANFDGRNISSVTYSQSQSVWASSVVDNGNGTYTVTISPGVYFTNIRSGQGPGAWWVGVNSTTGVNNGLEGMTIDQSPVNSNPVAFYNCYQCWVKNIRFLYGGRSDMYSAESLNSVVRDSYFYGAQTPGTSQSYGIEIEMSTSALLVENNIFQQTTVPVMFGQGSGNVIGYNLALNNQSGGTSMQYSYYSHNAGNEMNLWEGNNLNGINSDASTWGSSTQGTIFRNNLIGWQLGKNEGTYPISLESWSRAFNVVGNVLGEPSYHTIYESYATSTTGGVNGGTASVDASIYALGWTGVSGFGGCGNVGGAPPCGPLVRTTLMRWGNWDTVTNDTKWDTTEAAPAAQTGTPAQASIPANFTTTYFGTLAHTLPASLYYSAKPSWWPAGKNWPPIGPDVTTGNVGICTGTYAGVQGTLSSQCTGGTLSTAWASHVVSIPALDCYLNVMGGPPDGSGGVLSFDAAACFRYLAWASPASLTWGAGAWAGGHTWADPSTLVWN